MATTKTAKNISKKDCDICGEENISYTKFVSCPFCSFSSCKKCSSRFLMEIEDNRPRCMNTACKKVWSLEFISLNFDVSFHNKLYRNRRAYLLLQSQKALLPSTQHLVIRRKKQEENRNQVLDIMEENAMLQMLIERNKTKIRLLLSNQNPNIVTERAEFNRACPRNDCRGFLSTSLKCGTCEQYACGSCREPKNGKYDDDHKCDPSTVETIKLLVEDTKPCPKCSSMIHKLVGCDQMWCTQCHTAFSWIKGTIERGAVHNPHMYEFQRQQNGGVAPRVIGDIRCGGVVTSFELGVHVRQLNSTIDFSEIHRLMTHIRYVELPRYPNQLSQEKLDNMRVDFLLGKIDEKTWMSSLKTLSKKQEKNNSINEVLTMFVDLTGDILGNIMIAKSKNELEKSKESLESLRLYANNALKNIGNRFDNVYPIMTPGFQFFQNSKKTIMKDKNIRGGNVVA